MPYDLNFQSQEFVVLQPQYTALSSHSHPHQQGSISRSMNHHPNQIYPQSHGGSHHSQRPGTYLPQQQGQDHTHPHIHHVQSDLYDGALNAPSDDQIIAQLTRQAQLLQHSQYDHGGGLQGSEITLENLLEDDPLSSYTDNALQRQMSNETILEVSSPISNVSDDFVAGNGNVDGLGIHANASTASVVQQCQPNQVPLLPQHQHQHDMIQPPSVFYGHGNHSAPTISQHTQAGPVPYTFHIKRSEGSDYVTAHPPNEVVQGPSPQQAQVSTQFHMHMQNQVMKQQQLRNQQAPLPAHLQGHPIQPQVQPQVQQRVTTTVTPQRPVHHIVVNSAIPVQNVPPLVSPVDLSMQTTHQYQGMPSYVDVPNSQIPIRTPAQVVIPHNNRALSQPSSQNTSPQNFVHPSEPFSNSPIETPSKPSMIKSNSTTRLPRAKKNSVSNGSKCPGVLTKSKSFINGTIGGGVTKKTSASYQTLEFSKNVTVQVAENPKLVTPLKGGSHKNYEFVFESGQTKRRQSGGSTPSSAKSSNVTVKVADGSANSSYSLSPPTSEGEQSPLTFTSKHLQQQSPAVSTVMGRFVNTPQPDHSFYNTQRKTSGASTTIGISPVGESSQTILMNSGMMELNMKNGFIQ